MAYEATAAAQSQGVAEGSVGVGAGATVGKAAGIAWAMKGGVGCAERSAGSITVAAVVVVNAFGDVRDAEGQIIAGARAHRGGFLDAARALADDPARLASLAAETALRNTTLGLIATNAALDRVQLTQLARAASAAFYKRITPVGTAFDGDVIFALGPYEGVTAPLLQLEALATAALEDAIERAVRLAVGRGGVPGLAELAWTRAS